MYEGDIPLHMKMKTSLQSIKDKIDAYVTTLSENRTSKPWLQYLDMIQILKKSTKAERTGNVLLYLQSVQNVQSYLAESGYNHYDPSGRLYLQEMMILQKKEQKKDIYDLFPEGHQTCRRTARFGQACPQTY